MTEEKIAETYEMAVRYQQTSAEVHALQIQAYRMAKMRLEQMQMEQHRGRPQAIVIDLDETVLDNMPFVAQGIKEGFDFTKWGANWYEWVEAACADAIPGSKEFLRYADESGVHIFYVSNRKSESLVPTMKNLNRLGLPQVKEERVLLSGTLRTKKERRRKIAQNYEIILLIGNSLYDLSSRFIHESTKDQIKVVNELADHFGDKFIILPNAAYGDYWVDAQLESWKAIPNKIGANESLS